MLKNLACLECKVEERIIKFICDNDCPLTHLKEALFQFQKYIGQIEDLAKSTKEKSDAEALAKSSEEPIEEQKTE